MKNFTKVLVLLAFFLFCHELSSQEWISTNGGRVYYFGYPMQLPEDNISPPESSKTIADYELIGEVSIESFEGISSIIGDVNSNGLPEVYIPSHNLITYFSELKVYEFSPDLSYTLYVFDQIKGWI